jgi:hypothetical protein
VDVINLYSSRLNVALEVMILEGNMFHSRGELLQGSHRDARLIVFPNFAVEFWHFHQEKEHFVQLVHDSHQQDYLTQGRGQSDALRFGHAQGNLSLKLA